MLQNLLSLGANNSAYIFFHRFLNNIGFFFPLMMMLTWMVSVASMVHKLVYEREIHLEEVRES